MMRTAWSLLCLWPVIACTGACSPVQKNNKSISLPGSLHANTSPTPPALQNATKVADVNGWAENDDGAGYYWLSDNSILFLRPADGDATLWRFNIQTKVETRTDPGISFIEEETAPITSPDGRWLLRFDPGGIVINELGGSRSEEWEHDGKFISWFNDSRHWIELVKMNALIHSLDASIRTETIRLPRTSMLLRKDIADGGFYTIRCLSKSLFVAHTDLEPHPNRPETFYGRPQVDLFAGRLDADARHTKQYTFHPPTGYRVFDVVFSPDGTQVVWLLQSPTTGRVSLRVSRLDLSNMRELGTLEDRWADHNSLCVAARYSLRWLPNGKRLSFLYQNTLWTIPVDLPAKI